MKRTTIYLEPDLELRLKMAMRRRKKPMAWIVREAVEAYLVGEAPHAPPGAGAFASGHADTSERAEEILAATRFGEAASRPRATSTRTRRPARAARRT